MFKKYLSKRRDNILFLRKTASIVGAEIESWPYEKLSQPAEDISFIREINGISISFSIDAYEKNNIGDIHICIDVNSNIPTFPYIKLPSYIFWKKQNESVYY